MIKFEEFNLRIILSDELFETLVFYSQKTSNNYREYGGIILGRVTENGEVYLDIASEPSMFDISRALSFIRKKSPAQRIINRIWRQSNGKINYLGEWHTHPFGSNTPSLGDIDMITGTYKNSSRNFGFIVMIIMDTNLNFSISIMKGDRIVTKGGLKNEKVYNKL